MMIFLASLALINSVATNTVATNTVDTYIYELKLNQANTPEIAEWVKRNLPFGELKLIKAPAKDGKPDPAKIDTGSLTDLSKSFEILQKALNQKIEEILKREKERKFLVHQDPPPQSNGPEAKLNVEPEAKLIAERSWESFKLCVEQNSVQYFSAAGGPTDVLRGCIDLLPQEGFLPENFSLSHFIPNDELLLFLKDVVSTNGAFLHWGLLYFSQVNDPFAKDIYKKLYLYSKMARRKNLISPETLAGFLNELGWSVENRRKLLESPETVNAASFLGFCSGIEMVYGSEKAFLSGLGIEGDEAGICRM